LSRSPTPGGLAGTPGTALTKDGFGELRLLAPSPGYDGADTYIRAGGLALGDRDALGDGVGAPRGTIHFANQTWLDLTTVAGTNFDYPVRVSGSLRIDPFPRVHMQPAAHRMGALTVAAPSFVDVGVGGIGPKLLAFGDVVLNADLHLSLSAPVALGTITEDAAPRKLSVSGFSALTLAGGSTHSGGTVLSSGPPVVVADSSVGPAGAPTSGPFGRGTLTINVGGVQTAPGVAVVEIGNPLSLTGDLLLGSNVRTTEGWSRSPGRRRSPATGRSRSTSRPRWPTPGGTSRWSGSRRVAGAGVVAHPAGAGGGRRAGRRQHVRRRDHDRER
jgi:hypothetical protein